jgi:hypothetical protein
LADNFCEAFHLLFNDFESFFEFLTLFCHMFVFGYFYYILQIFKCVLDELKGLKEILIIVLTWINGWSQGVLGSLPSSKKVKDEKLQQGWEEQGANQESAKGVLLCNAKEKCTTAYLKESLFWLFQTKHTF